MLPSVARHAVMVLLLAAGWVWFEPPDPSKLDPGARFEEMAERAGVRNQHTLLRASPRFDNIRQWISSIGAAVAGVDYDNDGWTDFYVTNSGPGSSNRLFHNRGDGTFEEVAAKAGVACASPEGANMHAVFGDVNNDGWLDLYLVRWGAKNQLLLSQKDGTFRDVTDSAGLGYWGYGHAATFVDYDRDGWLDLVLGNQFANTVRDPRTGQFVRSDLWNPVSTRVMPSSFTDAENGGGTRIYHNLGNGRFEDVTEAMGLKFHGWAHAVGAGDLDNDGWPDLYIANDFGPDELYFNTGATEWPPHFRRVIDTTGHPGIGNDWWKGMNVDFGDVDRNGYLDIYVTNIFAPPYKTDEGNMLWLNVADPERGGGRRFWNAGRASGTSEGGWGWGGKFVDVNNDGLLDIFTVNGFITGDPKRSYWYDAQELFAQARDQFADAASWPTIGDHDFQGHERSRLFVQLPSARRPEPRRAEDAFPRFAELSAQAGIDDEYNGRGVAVVDYDNDGALDLYVANQGAPSLLYHNRLRDSSQRHGWLGLKLVGRPELAQEMAGRRLATSVDAVGTRVELTAGGITQIREVSGGIGFASQSEFRLHFGLGDLGVPERLVVRWPSGRVQRFEGPPLVAGLNGYARLVEAGTLEPGAGAGRPIGSKAGGAARR
jgi:enediyne biosynthesis protein E4